MTCHVVLRIFANPISLRTADVFVPTSLQITCFCGVLLNGTAPEHNRVNQDESIRSDKLGSRLLSRRMTSSTVATRTGGVCLEFSNTNTNNISTIEISYILLRTLMNWTIRTHACTHTHAHTPTRSHILIVSIHIFYYKFSLVVLSSVTTQVHSQNVPIHTYTHIHRYAYTHTQSNHTHTRIYVRTFTHNISI